MTQAEVGVVLFGFVLTLGFVKLAVAVVKSANGAFYDNERRDTLLKVMEFIIASLLSILWIPLVTM